MLVTLTRGFPVPCNCDRGITRLQFVGTGLTLAQGFKHQMRFGCWIRQFCKLLSACKGILCINMLSR